MWFSVRLLTDVQSVKRTECGWVHPPAANGWCNQAAPQQDQLLSAGRSRWWSLCRPAGPPFWLKWCKIWAGCVLLKKSLDLNKCDLTKPSSCVCPPVQDPDVFKYHVIVNELLFPDHLTDGLLKSTMLGSDYQVQFHLNSNNQVMTAWSPQSRPNVGVWWCKQWKTFHEKHSASLRICPETHLLNSCLSLPHNPSPPTSRRSQSRLHISSVVVQSSYFFPQWCVQKLSDMKESAAQQVEKSKHEVRKVTWSV